MTLFVVVCLVVIQLKTFAIYQKFKESDKVEIRISWVILVMTSTIVLKVYELYYKNRLDSNKGLKELKVPVDDDFFVHHVLYYLPKQLKIS